MFAFWELMIISNQFPARRKTIYEEIERKDGTTWEQVWLSSMAIVESIHTRTLQHFKPSGSTASQPAPPRQPDVPEHLPRISAPIKDDPILLRPPIPSNRREKMQDSVERFARSHGQTAAPSQNENTPIALGRWMLQAASDQALSPAEQKQLFSTSQIRSQFWEYLLDFLRSPVGVPFRRTLRRQCAAIVLGSKSPSYDIGLIISAIDSISQLTTRSIDEDPFGKVQAYVPQAIRVFTAVIHDLDMVRRTLQRHWTDVVDHPNREQKRGKKALDHDSDFEDVDRILVALRSGLLALLNSFEQYAPSLGIGSSDLRAAKQAADAAASLNDPE